MAKRADRKKYHVIYKTTCSLTGRYYIGMHSTDNLEDGYIGSGKRLRYSINKHGLESHQKEILELCETREALRNREKELVNPEVMKDPLCMNLKLGGEGGWEYVNNSGLAPHKFPLLISQFGCKRIKWLRENDKEWLEKYKKKLSLSLKGHKVGFTGKKHSLKTKSLISNANKISCVGRKNSQYGTCWIYHPSIKKNFKIKNNQLYIFLSVGYIRGRNNETKNKTS